MPKKIKVLISPLQEKKLKISKGNANLLIQARRKKNGPLIQYDAIISEVHLRGEPRLVGGARKDNMDSLAMIAYEKMRKKIATYIGHDGTTSREELDRAGRHFLKGKYKGAFAADEQPELSKQQPYALINTKPSPGEHWMAEALVDGETVRYDSFGEEHTDTDPDAEQLASEDNCGQRSLAWLVVLNKLGLRDAMTI